MRWRPVRRRSQPIPVLGYCRERTLPVERDIDFYNSSGKREARHDEESHTADRPAAKQLIGNTVGLDLRFPIAFGQYLRSTSSRW